METVKPEVAETVLVFRRELDVEILHLSMAEGHFLMLLMEGAGLALAADAAVEHDQRFDLAAFMANLIRLQLITSISTGDITPLQPYSGFVDRLYRAVFHCSGILEIRTDQGRRLCHRYRQWRYSFGLAALVGFGNSTVQG
jgi:hypothetical protein